MFETIECVHTLDVKEMFIDKMEFAISNYDHKVYYRHDARGTIITAHAVDDFTILASPKELKHWTIIEIRKVYPDITIQDEIETMLGLEVSRDRPNRTITLREEGSIHNCLNAHFPEWKTVPVEDLPHSTLPPMPPRMYKSDTLLDNIVLTDRDKTLYQRKVGELAWITHTVPELMFVYKLKAKKNANPTELDIKHVYIIIRYLARLLRTNDISLVTGGDQGINVIGTVDTSYTLDGENYKSITGATLHTPSNTGSMLSICARRTIYADSSMSAEGIGCHLLVRRILP